MLVKVIIFQGRLLVPVFIVRCLVISQLSSAMARPLEIKSNANVIVFEDIVHNAQIDILLLA